MKHLYVMRHAKSSWKDRLLSDFERPLNKRGKRTAPLMGELMRKRDFVPDQVVSSPAARAVETYRLVCDAGEFDVSSTHQRAIYEASLNTLLTVVSTFDNDRDRILMTGHNPGFEMLVQHLAGRYLRMPTAALAVFEIAVSEWSETTAETAFLRDYVIPKEIFI